MKKQVKDYLFVSIQFILFLLYVLPIDLKSRIEFPAFLNLLGILFLTLGIIILIWSIYSLRKSLTVFPTPKSNAELISTGVYKLIRHPIYTGVFLSSLGYGFYLQNTYKILVSVSILLLFYFKSKYEEERLKQKFINYDMYMKNTKRFFPFY